MIAENINIGSKVKQIREKLGLKQGEFADFVSSLGHKVTYSTISHYEKNKSRPSYEILIAICKLGNVSPSWVFDYEDNEVDPPGAISSVDTVKYNGMAVLAGC